MSRRTRNKKEAALGAQAAATTDQRRAVPALAWTCVAALAFFVALLVFGWFTQFYSPTYVRDPDELYHFHHALIYRLHGPWLSAFPWVSYSVISRYNSDLWYGYHVLLIPFTFGNPIAGLKLGSVVVTACAAMLVWWAVRLRDARLSFLWPILFLFGTGFGLSRFYTLRPAVVSMALTALLLSALFADRRKLAAACGAVFAFVHLTVIWLPLLVCATASVMSRLFDGRWRGRVIGWTCAGIAIGAFLRPNPIGGAHLLFVQTIVLAQAKLSGAVPSDVQEMLPLGRTGIPVIAAFSALLLAATIALIAKWRSGGPGQGGPASSYRGYIATTGVLTIVFGTAAIVAALRCLEQFQAFGTLYLCAVASAVLAHSASPGRVASASARFGPVACAALIGAAFIWMGAPNAFRGDPDEDLNVVKYHDAAAWLRNNTPAGSIVFHSRWSDFSSLWFWDDHNRYIAGMDPIFSYAASPQKFPIYNEFRLDYSLGRQSRRRIGDPAAAMRRDFAAKYVVVDAAAQPNLAGYLSHAKSALNKFGRGDIEVFELQNPD